MEPSGSEQGSLLSLSLLVEVFTARVYETGTRPQSRIMAHHSEIQISHADEQYMLAYGMESLGVADLLPQMPVATDL